MDDKTILSYKLWFHFSLTYLSLSYITYRYDLSDFKYFKKKILSKEVVKERFNKALKNIFINILFFTHITIYFPFYILTDLENPNKYGFLVNLFFTLSLSEIMFYTIHKTFHSKFLYKYHKIHHEYVETNGISALYTDPIDYVFGNVLPFTFCIVFLNPPLYYIYTMIFLFLSNSIVLAHSNYTFTDDFHKVHHKYSNVNYGILTIMDRIFGTYSNKELL